MAPAQIVDLSQTQAVYNHKKFQGNCNNSHKASQAKCYSHKKFGSRTPPLENINFQQKCETENSETIVITTETQLENPASKVAKLKVNKGDIFRPYALDDKITTRKRKHQELVQDDEQCHQLQQSKFSGNQHDIKRFAASPSNTTPAEPVFFLPPTAMQFPYLPLPFLRLQHYQFNAQAFAVILQKQQAALCLGEILKRQPDFNLYNVIGH